MVDAKTLDLIIVAHLLTQDKELEENVMFRTGQSHHRISTDTIECSRTNVEMPTVGNSMIFQAHINA